MKARIVYNLGTIPRPEFPNGKMPAGTVIEHPDAYKLVRRGCAEAADEECEKAADITPEQWKLANAHYARTDAGIHPEDFAAWDRGEMRGYSPDGSWIPGPNYTDEGLELTEEFDDEC